MPPVYVSICLIAMLSAVGRNPDNASLAHGAAEADPMFDLLPGSHPIPNWIRFVRESVSFVVSSAWNKELADRHPQNARTPSKGIQGFQGDSEAGWSVCAS
jgi:hypothetical protein